MELKQIDRLAYLMARHFMEILTVEENEELEQWLDEDEQNRQLLYGIKRRNFYTEKQIENYLFDASTAFRKVRNRRQQYVARHRVQKAWWRIAAVAVVVVGISFVLLYESQRVQIEQFPLAELTAGESQAILILDNGQRLELKGNMSDSVILENGTKLNATGESVQYDQGQQKVVSVGWNVLEVPKKGEFQLVLSDGTKVWINSESRIKYPVSFHGNERRVYLEGEAYFEVSKNKEMPFVVELGKAAVQVLGTSFNIKAYRDEKKISATLAEGRIRLETAGQSLHLLPEEQGIVDLIQGDMTKKKVDVQLYTSWKDGRFVFQKQSLEEMMNTLSRWYDIQVFFENASVRNVTFSGNLKRYDSFNKIIELLEMTGMAHFKVDGNTILISE